MPNANTPAHLARASALLLAALAAAPLSLVGQTTGFNKGTAGPHDYDDIANWVGGTINGVWNSDLTLTAAQAITFDSDLAFTTGLSFGHAGNFGLTLRGDGTNRTITLGGDITVATTGGGTANVTLGSSTAGQNLNINLGGVTRTASVAASRTLTLTNVVSNGSLEKTGAGTLTLAGANTFGGGLTLTGGTLSLNNNAALGTGALTVNGGTIVVNATRTTTNNNLQNWNGDFTYGGGGTWNTGTGAVTMNGNRAVTVTSSTLTVGGAIGETGGSRSLTKSGAGTMILNGANTYTGGTIIDGGILQFGSGAVPSTGDITISSGGILNANNALANVTTWLSEITTSSSGVLALTGDSSENLDFSNHSNLILGATTASTYSGTLTPSGGTYRLGGGTAALTVATTLAGTGNSLVVGPTGSAGTTVTLTSANTYTGGTTINSGTLTFSGATGSAAASAVTANAGTTVVFDSSTAGVTGATRAASLTLKDAKLTVTGNGTANSVDTITNALTVDAPSTWGSVGANTVTVTAGTMNAQLAAGSLVRANNGAVFFRGTNLGLNSIASATPGATNISFANSPAAQLVGGGGTAGSKNISILPWAVGSTSATGVPTGFVTYDTNGIRVLTSSEVDTTITGGTSTTNNVSLSAAAPVIADGATTINSLFLSNGASSTTVLSGTGALTVTSGAIFADFSLGGNSNALSISKQIDFGSAEGVIGTMGSANSKTLSFSGGISGSGGITIYTTGTTPTNQGGVNLSAANTYTGDTVILGQAIAANINALPNFTNNSRTGDVYVYGTLGLSGSNNSSVRMNGLWGSGRIITPFSNNETLIVGDNNATSTFSGTITQTTGAIGLTKIGSGTLTLSGTSSTWTASTNIQNGILSAVTLNNIAAPNTSSSLGRPVTIAAGTIGLGNSTTTGTLRVTGTGETTDRVINLAGTTGGGGLEQAGTGLLKFTSDFTATGNGLKTLTLSGSTAGIGEIAGAIVNSSAATSVAKSGTGTWILSGANTYTGTTTVSAGTLALGAADRIADASNLVLAGGTFSTGGFNETLGTLTVSTSSIIDLGSGASALVFADSSGTTWGGSVSLSFINFTQGVDSIRIGTTDDGLTLGQLGQITINGMAASIDTNGYLTASAIPEPASFAALVGLGVLGMAALRRRRSA